MAGNIFTKSIRDHWIGMTVASVSLGLFLFAAMAMYRSIDLSLYRDLPDAVRQLAGYGDSVTVAGLAFGAVYSFMGALTLAGVAVSLGSSAIAGEEEDGTMGQLLSNPVSRTRVLSWKAAALVLLTVAGALVFWGFGELAPTVLDVKLAGSDVAALVFSMFVNALFYGTLALMIGAWTGNRSSASGVAAAVMATGYLAVSIFPLVSGLEDLARIFPWYYYDSGQPLTNGVDWPDIGVLCGAGALFVSLAVVGFRRRDIRERTVGRSILDRLRDLPLTHRMIDRMAGSVRVSRISVKTTSEYQSLVVLAGLVLLLMGVTMGPLYNSISGDLTGITNDLSDGVLALIGNADMSTPEGWYVGESFSLVTPIAMIAVGVLIGARSLAGEERNNTMGLLLANPVSRGRVVLEQARAVLALLVLLGLLTFVGTLIGSTIAGLGLSVAGIAAISLLASLLGFVFGATALALGAATGKVKVAIYGAAGIALASYLANSMLPLSKSLAGYAKLSPFYYYLGGEPLSNGMDWGHAAVLAAIGTVLVLLSVQLFRRRDLR